MGFQRNGQVKWHPGEYGMYLECPYHKDLVVDMKRDVPEEDRRWDSKKKQWWISDCYLDEVDSLLFTYFEKSGLGREP